MDTASKGEEREEGRKVEDLLVEAEQAAEVKGGLRCRKAGGDQQ